MRHAVRSDIGGDKPIAQAIFFTEGRNGLAVSGGKLLKVDAVFDHCNRLFFAVFADMMDKSVSHRDDQIGLAIGPSFNRFEQADNATAFHRADCDDAFGPKVTDFQHPRPIAPLEQRARQSAEKLWRC